LHAAAVGHGENREPSSVGAFCSQERHARLLKVLGLLVVCLGLILIAGCFSAFRLFSV
jgi:hypothetical protein